MTVLRVTVPDQYFCTKHPDLNITAREKKVGWGQVSLPMEKYSPLVLNEIWGLGIVLTLCKVPQGVDIQDLLTFLMDNGLGCYVT